MSPRASRACTVCAGRSGAHFGWCSEVGGPGIPPAEQRRLAELAAVERHAEQAERHVLDAFQRHGLLREARASVALDGETQTFEPPAPVPPLPEQAPEPPAPVASPVPEQAPERPKPSICERCGQAGGRHALNCGMRLTPSRPQLVVVPTLDEAADEQIQQERREGAWRWTGPDPEWEEIGGFELESTATDLLYSCMNGLPKAVPYMVRDDVLAMEGFDPEAIERVLREPAHVEVRPETYEKGYPILGFRRADVRVILGLRTPRRPAVIAAYWTSLLSGYDPSMYRARTGGGGSKSSTGIPTSASALVKRLRAFGAHIGTEHHVDADLTGQVTVTYHGQDLGKISAGKHVGKQTVESDWNRMQRKIHAIDLREQKVGGNS